MMSGAHQGITLIGDGFAFSNAEATAGSTYQEFSIQKVSAARHRTGTCDHA